MDADDIEGKTVVAGSEFIEVGEQINGGNEGVVYHIESNDDSVVKIFKQENRGDKEPKLRAMVKDESRPVDLTFEGEGVRSIIWPEVVVENPENDEFLGFKMPKKTIEEAKTAISYALSDLQWDESLQIERMKVARNFASMVETIHKQGHAIGDFNDDNIFIDDGYITLIDCDAFHIVANGNVFGGDTWYPEHAPPERRPKDRREVQMADRFSLGIYVFRFLLEGNHPFVAKGPKATSGDLHDMLLHNPFPYSDSEPGIEPHANLQSKYNQLPVEIQSAFERCFLDGKSNPEKRPDPEEWRTLIEEASSLNVRYKTREEEQRDSPSWSRWDIQRDQESSGGFPDGSDPWEGWNI